MENKALLSRAMLNVYRDYGITVDKVINDSDDNVVVFMTIPLAPNFNEREVVKFRDGFGLAMRIQETFNEMTEKQNYKMILKYKIKEL